MGKLIDLTGQRFGRLVVIERAGSDSRGYATWLCRCDCGSRVVTNSTRLMRGGTKSCGCIGREVGKKNSERNTTHGKRHTRIYRIWAGMRSRCNGKTDQSYKNYGGRGIRVCPEWDDFSTFYEWALANGYRDGLTIDRINNDGDYEPSNCRWIDRKQQGRNRRNNHLITYKGKERTLVEWAELLSIPQYVLFNRLKAGWSIERALETPVQFHNKHR